MIIDKIVDESVIDNINYVKQNFRVCYNSKEQITLGCAFIDIKYALKEVYGHGFWIQFVEENFMQNKRTIQTYMQYARKAQHHYPKTPRWAKSK